MAGGRKERHDDRADSKVSNTEHDIGIMQNSSAHCELHFIAFAFALHCIALPIVMHLQPLERGQKPRR